MSKSKDITLTSKNQITLPAEYVREMGVGYKRSLKAELMDDGRLVLTAEPDLSVAMRKFWGRHKVVKAVPDEDLKAAAHQAAVRRAH